MITLPNKTNKGFTLVEILIVIAIIASLASVFISNFFASIARGRDSRRKQDLRSIVNALELYYNDLGRYPDDLPAASIPFTHPDDENTIYLKETPKDPSTGVRYCYETADGNQYKLTAQLENIKDSDILLSPITCGGVDFNYGVTSSNLSL